LAGSDEGGRSLKIGAALIPLVGWAGTVGGPDGARSLHLDAIRRLIGDFGLQAVELNGDFTTLFPHAFDGAYYKRVAELQQKLRFACTVHLPFLWLDGLSMAEPVRKATVQCVAKVVELTQPLSVESYVLHLWGTWSSLMATIQEMPVEEKRPLLDGMLCCAARTLDEIGGIVSPHEVCVENLERFPFGLILPLIEERDMRICLDVGHLAVDGGDALEFLHDHWELIGEVHLHDALPGGANGPGVRDHLPLGRGEVDYAGIMDRLAEGGYEGVLILEVNTEAHLRESVERVRPWL
jgi:sugar phosphate isomerase/epimerase